MTLKDFREHTKDLPETTRILVLSGGVWTPIASLKTFTESLLFVEGRQNIPEELKGVVELRIELPRG